MARSAASTRRWDSFFQKPVRPDDRLKRLVLALLPSVLVDQMAASLLGIVNTIMTSHVSQAAVAGVGQVDAIANIFVAIFNSLAVGGTVIAAQAFGRGDRKAADHAATQALTWGGVVSLGVGLAVFFLRAPLLRLLYPSVEQAVFESSMDYFYLTSLSIPLSFVVSQGGGVFRAVGDAKTPMRIGVLMNVVNIAVGFVAIGGVGPIEGLGSFGAGIAIFASRLLGSVLMMRALLRRTARVRFEGRSALHFDWKTLRGCVSIGLPAALESLLFQVGRLMLQVAVSGMGTVMITASQVTNSASGIIVIPVSALTVAVVTVIGNYAGEGDRDGCRRAMRFITTLATIYSLFIGAFLLLFPQPLCYIYTSDPEVISAASDALRVCGLGMVAYSHSFVPAAGFRGTGDVKFALVVSTITMWVFRVFFVYLVIVPAGLGVAGVWIGFILDWAARAVCFTLRERSGKWLTFIRTPEPEPEANAGQ